jgi:hypothetical protein
VTASRPEISEHPGPGPRERKWTSQLRFKLFGRWPESVVDERLARSDIWRIENRTRALRAEHAALKAASLDIEQCAYEMCLHRGHYDAPPCLSCMDDARFLNRVGRSASKPSADPL